MPPDGGISFLSDQAGNSFCQGSSQVFVALFGQMHIVHGVELRSKLGGVQEVAADERTLLLIILRQLPGFFRE